MTSSNNRLDRLEALLEHSMVASDERMTRLEHSMVASDERMTRLEHSMVASDERMTRIDERLGQITERQQVTDAQIGVLVTCVDELAVDVRRVINYLEGQSGNGRHGG